MNVLLSRDDFREQVFIRDKYHCIVCGCIEGQRIMRIKEGRRLQALEKEIIKKYGFSKYAINEIKNIFNKYLSQSNPDLVGVPKEQNLACNLKNTKVKSKSGRDILKSLQVPLTKKDIKKIEKLKRELSLKIPKIRLKKKEKEYLRGLKI